MKELNHEASQKLETYGSFINLCERLMNISGSL